MTDPVLESSSLMQCLKYTEKLISKNMPFKLDIKLPNGFVFNMSWNDDKETKQRKDLMKSPSTLKRNFARKKKFLQEKKPTNKHETESNIVKEREVQKVIKCQECNLKVNSEKQLESHKLKKHKIIEMLRCEYGENKVTSKNYLKEHIEMHIQDENGQHGSQYNSEQSCEPQFEAYTNNGPKTIIISKCKFCDKECATENDLYNHSQEEGREDCKLFYELSTLCREATQDDNT